MKISVIVPVYNVERYLDECIQSILNQDFKDFEVLLINDGSTDKSGEICEEYANKDLRIRVFHKENGGVSSARNLGLDNAKGEWITFVDSDDWIGENYFYCLTLNNENVGLILLNVERYYSNKVQKMLVFDNFILNKNEFLNNYTLYPHFPGPCAKFFKHENIQKMNLRFDEKLSFGEDALFNIKYVNSAILLIKSNNNSYYNYRDTNNGLSKTSYEINKEKYLFQQLKKELLKFDDKKIYLKNIIYPLNRYLLSIYRNKEINQKKELINLLKNDKDSILYLFRNSKINHLIIKYGYAIKLFGFLNLYLKNRIK
ncbi:glycosyltransferase family 2 protein [Aequorivita sinensis]|uniref:glycosyltransferase family 2 protein n=1 Tax=Aequorivita sinensis TaxID=1382458 RepID=UPI002301A1AE|nr:glycosyltransferase family 2 protein [Aequorivita sinensis]